MNSIYTRRSIRKYQDKPVEKEIIEQILRAAMQAPSAGNQQPWEFIVVEDKGLLKKLSGMSLYSKMIEDSAFSIIVLGNMERCRFPKHWEQDLGACTQNILLEAVEQGLGAVWLGVAPEEERMAFVKDLFPMDESVKPFSIIPIGYPLEDQGNKFIDRFDENRINYYK